MNPIYCSSPQLNADKGVVCCKNRKMCCRRVAATANQLAQHAPHSPPPPSSSGNVEDLRSRSRAILAGFCTGTNTAGAVAVGTDTPLSAHTVGWTNCKFFSVYWTIFFSPMSLSQWTFEAIKKWNINLMSWLTEKKKNYPRKFLSDPLKIPVLPVGYVAREK